jgi:hypothetical protein
MRNSLETMEMIQTHAPGNSSKAKCSSVCVSILIGGQNIWQGANGASLLDLMTAAVLTLASWLFLKELILMGLRPLNSTGYSHMVAIIDIIRGGC